MVRVRVHTVYHVENGGQFSEVCLLLPPTMGSGDQTAVTSLCQAILLAQCSVFQNLCLSECSILSRSAWQVSFQSTMVRRILVSSGGSRRRLIHRTVIPHAPRERSLRSLCCQLQLWCPLSTPLPWFLLAGGSGGGAADTALAV